MKAPVDDFRLPINLSNWFDFDPSVIIAKREAIAEVIKRKIIEQLEVGQDMPMLPEISFYKSDEEQKTENENRISNGNGECKEDPVSKI